MWDTLSKILNIIQAILLLYFYLENRKLKEFETEKKLTIKKAELAKLLNDHYQNLVGVDIYLQNVSFSDRQKEENNFDYKKICLEAEVEYLEKILKINKK